MNLDQLAANMGYQKMTNGSWFHPETTKNVQIVGGTLVVTEEVSFESDAQIAHVLTCNAGLLDSAFLSKVDKEWTFTTEESLHQRFAVVLMHSPTGMVCTPINKKKVTFDKYIGFLDNLAEEACAEHGMKLRLCEVTATDTEVKGLAVLLVASIEEGQCPFHGIHASALLKVEPEGEEDKAVIAVLKSILVGDLQQSLGTSEREVSHLVHSPDANTSIGASVLSIP